MSDEKKTFDLNTIIEAGINAQLSALAKEKLADTPERLDGLVESLLDTAIKNMANRTSTGWEMERVIGTAMTARLTALVEANMEKLALAAVEKFVATKDWSYPSDFQRCVNNAIQRVAEQEAEKYRDAAKKMVKDMMAQLTKES